MIKIIRILQSRVIGVILTIILFSFFQNSYSQVKVSRQGFPFCEPFTSSTSYNSQIIKGIGDPNNSTQFANNSLQLTDATKGPFTIPNTTISANGKFGYAYLDVPFSSQYGIKASFEYFMYGGTLPQDGDGFSFFLFDGEVGDSGSEPFQIGWPGGSLGYAQIDVSDDDPTKVYPGLKKGFIGIGFDKYGIFGSYYQGKEGGFNDSLRSLKSEIFFEDTLQHADAVVIRGPAVANYPFVFGKRVNDGNDSDVVDMDIWEEYYLYPNPTSDRFSLSSVANPFLNGSPLLCQDPGYRKVFFDLFPNPVKPGFYLVSVSMLVGSRRVDIIKDYEYNYAAPPTLKIGFAASTGDATNFHEIRNLAVDVAKIESLAEAKAPDVDFEICQGDDNTIERRLGENDLTDPSAFIQCINIYVDGQDGFNYANPSTWPSNVSKIDDHLQYDIDNNNCGLTPICNFCSDTNQSKITSLGTFTVDLDELDLINNDNNRKVKIKFEGNGNIGEQSVYYTILDNYGQISEPGKITAIVNPYPIEIGRPSGDDLLNPSCDGQSDGSLSNYIIGNLVDGFDYEWFYEDISIGKLDADVSELTNLDQNNIGQASFELRGLNIGRYTLSVWNPRDDDGRCEEKFDIEIEVQSGTPVELEPYANKICEGTDAVISPTIDPQYNPSNLPVPFLWYTSPDRSAGSLITNATTVIDGANVTVDIDGSGQITITGLEADGLNPKDYTLYVETDFKDNASVDVGNFCQIDGAVATQAVITVYPALEVTSTVVADWCRVGSGAIEVFAQGGTGNKTFTLYSAGSPNPLRAPVVVTGTTYTFSGLLPGDYEVEVSTENPTCTKLIGPITIEGPAIKLALTPVSTENSYCGLPNGSLKFNLLGGNLPYSITINGNPLSSFNSVISGAEYTINNLAAGPYIIRVVDDKACPAQINQIIAADPLSQFGTTDDEICEGEVAIVSPTVVTLSSSVPVYKWYYKDGLGNYVQITNGLNLSGVTFAIDGSNKLSVSNLAPQATPYSYYLNVTNGSKVCDQGYIPAEILVNQKPIPVASLITQVTCNGAANGIIQAQLTSGNLGDFEYSLIGNNGVTRPFANNSGLFNFLPPGTYELKIKSAKGCEVSVPNLIITEPSPLLVNQVSKTDATCAVNNGEIRFNVTGSTPDGTGKYVVKVNGNDIITFGSSLNTNGPADFTISNLATGPYKIEVEDTKGCKKELTITILNTPIPVFDAQDVTVCEGTDAILTPQVVSNTIGAIPVYTWSYESQANPGQFTQINNGDVVNGATHTLSNGVLTIKGLKYSASNYSYYLTVAGTKVCPAAPPIQAEVKVLKIPTAVFETVAVSCFGGTNGQINLTSVDPAGPNTFTLVETGASNSTGNFSNLKAGTYTIKIKETGSPCQSEFKVIITEPAKLELLNPLKSDPTCGQINGSISFEVKGGVRDYQILINGKPLADYSFGQTVDRYEIKNLAPGTFSIQIADANGCVVDKPNLFVLINDDGLTVNINPLVEEKCVGSPAILSPVFGTALPVTPSFKWYKDASLLQPITSSPTPDSDNITYQIGPTGAVTINGLQEGDFKYFLEISGQGICTLVEEANVKIVPQILADIVVEDITCFGQKDGLIKVTPSGGNGNFEIRLNGGSYSVNTDYLNLAAGKYTVDIRNDIGCVTSYQVEVKGPLGPISMNNPSIIRASCDLDNGSIEDLVISGGWGSYSVEWRFGSATGTLITGDLTGAQNLAPGTYYLLVSDLQGCPATFTFVIGESSDPVYAVVPPINSCQGSKVSIRPIHIAPNPSLPPAAATEIQWYTGPGQTGLISNGADPTLTGVSYTIDDTDWLNPLLEIEGLPVGIHDFYFIVVCTGQEIKIETTVYSTPDVTFETDPITCFGDKNGKIRIISGDQAVYTYSINSASPITKSALEAMSFAAGTYNLVIATPAGCSQDLNLTIDGPSAALVSSPLTKIDPGCGAPNGKLELVVTGGWLPYTLDISKDGTSIGNQVFSQSNILIDGFTQGIYQITITDSEGCSVTTNSVTMVDGPTQILVDEEAICEGSNAALFPSLDPVASGATFQWFFNQALTLPIVSSPTPAADGNIYQINPSTGVLSVTGLVASPTDYSYYVTAAGSTVCQGFIGEGKIRVYGSPVAVASVQNEVCFGDGGEITVNASGGSGSYTYSLNGGAFGTSNVLQVPTGTHQVEVKTPEGCNFILSTIQVTGPAAVLTAGNFLLGSPSCDLDNGEIRFDISGGYEPYTITYTKNGVDAGVLNLPAAGIISIPSLGEGVYAFKVKDAQGCEISPPASLSLIEEPSVITASDDFICEGESAQLVPSLPTNILNPSYSWSFDAEGNSPINSGQSNGVTFAINPNGMLDISGLAAAGSPYTYYVMASGQGVCGLSPKPVKVTVYGIPQLRVSNPSIVCDPTGTVDLTEFIEGFNPAVYDYNVVSPTGAAMTLDELDAVAVNGDYRVSSSVKGTLCWNQPQRIKVIIVDEELVASFQYEVDLGGGIILTNGEIQIEEDVAFMDLSRGDILLWQWEFGDGNSSGEQNPVHQFEGKGTYTVRLTTIDAIGCVSTYEIIVNVFDDYKVMVPTAFTPNGLENQYFKPIYRGISEMEFYIFNTWGELIFQTNSLESIGWDGTLNGIPVPNGNYVYRGKFISRSGEKFEKSGVFVLIR